MLFYFIYMKRDWAENRFYVEALSQRSILVFHVKTLILKPSVIIGSEKEIFLYRVLRCHLVVLLATEYLSSLINMLSCGTLHWQPLLTKTTVYRYILHKINIYSTNIVKKNSIKNWFIYVVVINHYLNFTWSSTKIGCIIWLIFRIC